jgi:hypothetical protein
VGRQPQPPQGHQRPPAGRSPRHRLTRPASRDYPQPRPLQRGTTHSQERAAGRSMPGCPARSCRSQAGRRPRG